MYKYFLYFIIFSCAFSCAPYDKKELLGAWQAVEVTEEGRVLNLNPSEINLNFNKDDYEFNSTISYKEAGHYKLDGKFLITKDSLNPSQDIKKVEILSLSRDSLKLKMKEADKLRILKLKRKG